MVRNRALVRPSLTMMASFGSACTRLWVSQSPLMGFADETFFDAAIAGPIVPRSIKAAAHPSRQLYTDSAVNLDAATGKLRWYYQAVPDDFADHDLQSSPIATTIGGVPVIIAGGKVGYVYALNARTGALLWKTPVGEHNGHDNDNLDG